MSFEAVAHDIETETSVRLGKAQVEQIVCDAAQDCDALYAQPCSPALQQHAQAKPIQVLTCDGKGVVMRQEALCATRPARKPRPVPSKRPAAGLLRQSPTANAWRRWLVSLTSTVIDGRRRRWPDSLPPCDWCQPSAKPPPSRWARSGGPVCKSP